MPQSDTDLVYLRKLKDQAFAGDVESQYQLGIHYTSKGKWAWDQTRGYNWFLDAANVGHPDAQYMVGMSQLLGHGTRQNQTGAIIWLTKAAEQGHSRSQYQLGQNYLNGTGVAKAAAWGRYWLEQAAWSGHPQAQLLLAALFRQGIGGQKNYSAAWAWLKRAEANRLKGAKQALNKLEASMTEGKMLTARKLFNQTESREKGGLFLRPKIRYIQTVLNGLGFPAGPEDGENGAATRKARRLYLFKNELPPKTSTDQLIEYLRGSFAD